MGAAGAHTAHAGLDGGVISKVAAVGVAEVVGLGIGRVQQAVLERAFEAAAGLRGHAGAGLNVGGIGVAQDAVVDGVAKIV
jgi:hypothetical protein